MQQFGGFGEGQVCPPRSPCEDGRRSASLLVVHPTAGREYERPVPPPRLNQPLSLQLLVGASDSVDREPKIPPPTAAP